MISIDFKVSKHELRSDLSPGCNIVIKIVEIILIAITIAIAIEMTIVDLIAKVSTEII